MFLYCPRPIRKKKRYDVRQRYKTTPRAESLMVSRSGMSFTLSIVHGTNSMPCTQAVSSDTLERLKSGTIFGSYYFVTPQAMVGYAVVAMLTTKL